MKNNKDSDASLGFIVFLMIVFPPAGVLFIVFKYVLPFLKSLFSDEIGTKSNRYSHYEKTGDQAFKDIWNSPEAKHNKQDSGGSKTSKPSKKKEKSRKLPYKTASLVLLIIAGVLVFSGLLSGVTELLEQGSRFVSSEGFRASVACFLTGGIVGGIGMLLRRKMRIIKKYISIIGERGFVKLEELATVLSVSVSKVKRELQDVIDSGVFGEYAYVDLSNNAFLRDSSFKPKADEKKKTNADTASDKNEIDEYESVLVKIRLLNEKILDQPVSDRIDAIETYTAAIFEYLRKNPDCVKNVHSFMTYYLPTTLKLLESYSEIERMGVVGDNMRSAKENIEKTLDLLVEAYKRLLDKLYESDNLDISSDIDVLEQMIKKDGLSGTGLGV